MLVTLKEVLKVAEEKEIAIGAFNAPNGEPAGSYGSSRGDGSAGHHSVCTGT